MIRIAICDNQAEFCVLIEKQLKEEYGTGISVTAYGSAEELQADYDMGKGWNIADILLISIELGGRNGIDSAQILQQRYKNLKVIFMAYKVDCAEGIFRVEPSDFLLKPFRKKKLLEAVSRVIRQVEEEDNAYFVVAFKGNIFKIKARDILYFESEKRTAILHGRKEQWTLYRKLDDIQKDLPDYFLRCHQSYLVNMNEIKSLKPLRVELYQGDIVPISRPKYKETREKFLEFLGKEDKEGYDGQEEELKN